MDIKGIDPVRVGIAGLGRSGWGIHGKTFTELSRQFRVVAITDPNAIRCAEAVERFDCHSYHDFTGLINDRHVELVVVATPNPLHATHTTAAIEAGYHVVCEKPMGLSTHEADGLIDTAQQYNIEVNPKRVRRLMKKLGLEAVYPRPRRNTSRSNPDDPKYPYLLRNLAITESDQVWCTDITYIRLHQGFAYLVAVTPGGGLVEPMRACVGIIKHA